MLILTEINKSKIHNRALFRRKKIFIAPPGSGKGCVFPRGERSEPSLFTKQIKRESRRCDVEIRRKQSAIYVPMSPGLPPVLGLVRRRRRRSLASRIGGFEAWGSPPPVFAAADFSAVHQGFQRRTATPRQGRARRRAAGANLHRRKSRRPPSEAKRPCEAQYKGAASTRHHHPAPRTGGWLAAHGNTPRMG